MSIKMTFTSKCNIYTMKNFILSIVLTVFTFLFFIPITWAPPLPPPHSTATPIDGGVTVLLGVGLVYAIRKLVKVKKN